MDYEKKYKEAFERAKAFNKRWQCIQAIDSELALKELKEIFPEFTENEDERIRKELIHYFSDGVEFLSLCSFSREEIIAWLEKQGNPNINPSELDLRINKLLKHFKPLTKEELTNCLSFYLNAVQNDGTYKADKKQCEQKSKDRYTFKSIPRLLDMIEPTDRAKSYCQKLIDSLLQEGYTTDAKIVSNCLKQMNGEKIAMATMDKSADKVEPIVVKDFNSVFSREQIEEIDKRIEKSQRLYNAKLRDAMRKVEDFPMTD